VSFTIQIDGGGASGGETVAGVVSPSTGTATTDHKSVTIPSPTASDSFTVFYTPTAMTLSEIRSLVSGTSPSATFSVFHGSSRASGTAVVTAGTTVTNTTTGLSTTTFDNATISAGSFVWINVTAVSGTINELSVTLIF
jgi:hypothetical protein